MCRKKLGDDSPTPKWINLKIQGWDGTEPLMTFEEGQFKMLTEGCIRCTKKLISQSDVSHNTPTWPDAISYILIVPSLLAIANTDPALSNASRLAGCGPLSMDTIGAHVLVSHSLMTP